MTNEELKTLGEKVGNGTATAEERLQFMTEINSVVKSMQSDLSEVASAE